ncbi:DNA replication and repair protein [Escherichia coli]|nr:DNA replication and repair protein [Escherichia coli]
MSQEAFVLHGRLQGEERETAIGLTKDKQGDSKVRIDGTDGHKVAELAHLMPMQFDNARRVYFTQRRPPNTEEHSSTGDAFTRRTPDFSPPGAISSDCSSSAMRRCAQVTRYEQLRPVG